MTSELPPSGHALEIDIFSDVVCPWCFIGTRRLEAALRITEGGEGFKVRHHPFILQPYAPPEGHDLDAS